MNADSKFVGIYGINTKNWLVIPYHKQSNLPIMFGVLSFQMESYSLTTIPSADNIFLSVHDELNQNSRHSIRTWYLSNVAMSMQIFSGASPWWWRVGTIVTLGKWNNPLWSLINTHGRASVNPLYVQHGSWVKWKSRELTTGLQNQFRCIHISWNSINWILGKKFPLISTRPVSLEIFQTHMVVKRRRRNTMGR